MSKHSKVKARTDTQREIEKHRQTKKRWNTMKPNAGENHVTGLLYCS